MSSGIYTAAAGAVAQSNALDITASNIANASTSGFQGARVTFREALAKAKSADTALVGAGTSAVDATNGVVTPTGNPLDVAVDGDGYFSVNTPRGARYTRDGSFQLGPDNTLVNGQGLAVRGVDGNAISIPSGTAQVAIDPSGNVRADGTTVGTIEVSHLDKTAVTHDSDNLLASSKPPIAGAPTKLVPGAVEGSNVNVVRGVVDLVKVSRTYESLMQVIQGYHECESRAAQTLGAAK